MKVPVTIAGGQDWPTKNRDKIAKLFRKLAFPYADKGKMQFHNTQGWLFRTGDIERHLDTIVYVRFLMLESPEQLEFRWGEVSETCFPTEPDVYASAGVDGILFDEPKLFRKGHVVTILEDGSLEETDSRSHRE
jgi:hypothetical protein